MNPDRGPVPLTRFVEAEHRDSVGLFSIWSPREMLGLQRMSGVLYGSLPRFSLGALGQPLATASGHRELLMKPSSGAQVEPIEPLKAQRAFKTQIGKRGVEKESACTKTELPEIEINSSLRRYNTLCPTLEFHTLKSEPPAPQSVTVSGHRVSTEILKVK